MLCLFDDCADSRPEGANVVLHGAGGVDGEDYVNVALYSQHRVVETGDTDLLGDELCDLIMSDEVRVVEFICVPTAFRLDVTVLVCLSFGLKKFVDPSMWVAIFH